MALQSTQPSISKAAQAFTGDVKDSLDAGVAWYVAVGRRLLPFGEDCAVPTEPSHIHVPRPSRINRPAATEREAA